MRTSPANKLLLPFQGKTIIQTVVDEIIPLNFAEILLITGHEEDKVIAALQGYEVRFVYNVNHALGIATSIKAGIAKSKPEVDGYMIVLGDMPWIDQTALKSLVRSFYAEPDSAIVVPVHDKRRGNPVIFARKYRNQLSKLDGDNGARSIINKFGPQVIEVQIKNERLLMDIDTWEDYENRKQNP